MNNKFWSDILKTKRYSIIFVFVFFILFFIFDINPAVSTILASSSNNDRIIQVAIAPFNPIEDQGGAYSLIYFSVLYLICFILELLLKFSKELNKGHFEDAFFPNKINLDFMIFNGLVVTYLIAISQFFGNANPIKGGSSLLSLSFTFYLYFLIVLFIETLNRNEIRRINLLAVILLILIYLISLLFNNTMLFFPNPPLSKISLNNLFANYPHLIGSVFIALLIIAEFYLKRQKSEIITHI